MTSRPKMHERYYANREQYIHTDIAIMNTAIWMADTNTFFRYDVRSVDTFSSAACKIMVQYY